VTASQAETMLHNVNENVPASLRDFPATLHTDPVPQTLLFELSHIL